MDKYDTKCSKCPAIKKLPIENIGSPCRVCGKGTMRAIKGKVIKHDTN